jgi:hypothetical protein
MQNFETPVLNGKPSFWTLLSFRINAESRRTTQIFGNLTLPTHQPLPTLPTYHLPVTYSFQKRNTTKIKGEKG